MSVLLEGAPFTGKTGKWYIPKWLSSCRDRCLKVEATVPHGVTAAALPFLEAFAFAPYPSSPDVITVFYAVADTPLLIFGFFFFLTATLKHLLQRPL